MRTSSFIKLIVAVMTVSQLSSCAVVAVGGVAATATILADRRSPGVQAIDKGIEVLLKGIKKVNVTAVH